MKVGRSLGDRLNVLLPRLRRGLVSDGDAEELFALLRSTIGAEGFVLGQDLDYRCWAVSSGVPEQWKADHSRLRREDPSIPVLVRSPPGSWWISERALTASQRQSELYERSRASGLRDVALTKIYSPFRDDLFLSIMRFDRRFTDRELDLLELLYPHLAAALATRRALTVLQGERGAPRAAAVLVSFPDGVVRADARARRAIERRTGPLGSIGWQKVTRALAASARRFSHAIAGGRSQVLWPGLRIDFAALRPVQGESARFVGFLIDEEAALPSAASPLVEALLSPQQLAIARDFVGGMTVGAIAEARRISQETVRAHLREARRRLGVHGRAGLAQALGTVT